MKFYTQTVAIMMIICAAAVQAFAQVPANNSCAGAMDISASFGHAMGVVTNTGPYDNTYATHHASDPANGFECFGEPNGNGLAPTLDNTLWFTFVGDGNLYYIETGQCTPEVPSNDYIDDGDTQIAIYKGHCGGLIPQGCNEDGPSSDNYTFPAGILFRTEVGVTYFMLVDGFNYNGVLSKGKFCLLVSKMPDVECNDPSVSPGNMAANKTEVCYNETVSFTTTGISTPNVGQYFGVSWVVSTTDLYNGLANLNTPGSVAGWYAIKSPSPATSVLTFSNDGSFIDGNQLPYGVYYWTPVVFGMGTLAAGSATATFLSDISLNPNCTYIGNSVPVQVYEPGTPGCDLTSTGANSAKPGFSITDVFPVPVTSGVSLTVNSVGEEEVTLLVKDVVGRVIESRSFKANAGANIIHINLQQQTAGMYFISATDGTNTAVKKIVKN